jgi:pimeloyl-ACP methyl ester carboxylesterase
MVPIEDGFLPILEIGPLAWVLNDIVLLAESFSGPIAISIPADRLAGPRGLILTGSFARNPMPMLAPLRHLIRLLPIRRPPMTLFSWLALGRFATPALRSKLADALSRVSPSVIRKRLRGALDVDVSPLLARVAVPVLYLRASEARLVPRSASNELSAMPHIRFAEIEGQHFLLQTSPSAAAAHVKRSKSQDERDGFASPFSFAVNFLARSMLLSNRTRAPVCHIRWSLDCASIGHGADRWRGRVKLMF